MAATLGLLLFLWRFKVNRYEHLLLLLLFVTVQLFPLNNPSFICVGMSPLLNKAEEGTWHNNREENARKRNHVRRHTADIR